MEDTLKRIKNPETLQRFGKQLRHEREHAGLAQGKVRGMRQATVSKIENGRDVNLDTFVSYANALGLELALVPFGQGGGPLASVPAGGPVPDLLTEFGDLKDEV